MTFPLVLGFGVFVLGAALVVAAAWALPLAVAVGYGVAWRRSHQPGSRWLLQLLVTAGAGLAFTAAGLVVIFSNLSGNAGHGVYLFGTLPLLDLPLLAPAALAPLVVVAGEALLRRRGRAPGAGE